MNPQLQSIESEWKLQKLTLEEYAELVADLEAEVMQLKSIVSNQVSLIEELQCQVK